MIVKSLKKEFHESVILLIEKIEYYYMYVNQFYKDFVPSIHNTKGMHISMHLSTPSSNICAFHIGVC